MTERDPKQVIIEFLSSPPGELEPNPLPSVDGGQPGALRKSGGFGAIATTIRFLKERSILHHQVHAVTFEDEAGRAWLFICLVGMNSEGQWHFEAGGGGGGEKGVTHTARRKQPWANLAGGGGEEQAFWAGGYVQDNGIPVSKVRLISKNGQVLEDIVEDDLVLFVTKQKIRMPMEAELYNLSSELVGKHSLFGP